MRFLRRLLRSRIRARVTSHDDTAIRCEGSLQTRCTRPPPPPPPPAKHQPAAVTLQYQNISIAGSQKPRHSQRKWTGSGRGSDVTQLIQSYRECLVFECRKICIRYKNNGDGAGIPLRVYIETGASREPDRRIHGYTL
ncbi:hypothetical protein KGM_206396 [Danaus plexippus plexippus]|uniref:Uncharacterized protein n=1 Tax=Danaus plexippus plexippus TaxID=278856 RepID=A0A212EQT2_DANPL|nr:hypothetical protein KGM_206396 [Danaus plexippus plexippus]